MSYKKVGNSEVKKNLLSSYGTNQEDDGSESVPATPVWGRGLSKQTCTCNSTIFYTHYLFIFYFGLLFLDSFLQGVDIGWFILFNCTIFLIQVACVYSMIIGRILMTGCIGGSLNEILLWPFGMFSTHNCHLEAATQFCLAMGEFVFLFPIQCIWWYIWKLTPTCQYEFLDYDDDWDNCFMYNVSSFGFMCTTFLVFFNLLVPVHPLHGAHALVWCLNKCQLGIESMAKLVITGSMVWFLFFCGCAVIYRNWLSALVAFFIFWQTWSLWQHFIYHGLQYHPLFEELSNSRKKSNIEKIASIITGSNSFQKDMKDVKEVTAALKSAPYQAKRAMDYKRGAYDEEVSQQAFEKWLNEGGKHASSSPEKLVATRPVEPPVGRKVQFKVAQEVLTVADAEVS